jgi:hypothetical protein
VNSGATRESGSRQVIALETHIDRKLSVGSLNALQGVDQSGTEDRALARRRLGVTGRCYRDGAECGNANNSESN